MSNWYISKVSFVKHITFNQIKARAIFLSACVQALLEILRKPQNFAKSSPFLPYVVPVKSKMKILQNFVAFSEYMNFTWVHFTTD